MTKSEFSSLIKLLYWAEVEKDRCSPTQKRIERHARLYLACSHDLLSRDEVRRLAKIDCGPKRSG
jgi:hypothetical protein